MTDKTPTDAQQYLNVASQCAATATSELAKNVLVDGGSGTLRELLNDAADAIRAGWGQPAQAAEPVAWLRNTTDPQPHAVTNLKYRSAADTDAGIEYIPVYTTPQHGEREPLTDVQIKDGHTGMPRDVWAFADGVRFAEQHHGIKGGQHVE